MMTFLLSSDTNLQSHEDDTQVVAALKLPLGGLRFYQRPGLCSCKRHMPIKEGYGPSVST